VAAPSPAAVPPASPPAGHRPAPREEAPRSAQVRAPEAPPVRSADAAPSRPPQAPPPQAPVVRAVNAPHPTQGEGEERLFPEEGPAGGCASGECLPEAASAPSPDSARGAWTPVPVPTSAPAAASPARPALRTPAPAVTATAAAPVGAAVATPVAVQASPAFARTGALPTGPAGAQAAASGYQAARWRSAVEAVRGASARHGASLAHARLLAMRPGAVRIGFTREAAFHRSTVSAPAGKALIEKALGEHFGQPTQLAVDSADVAAESAGPSLAESDAREKAEYERSTDGQVRNHPAVRAALRLLGGEIEHIQVLERERPAPPADGPEEAG
jgi:hypothetical protein